jgi:hypothetical protein
MVLRGGVAAILVMKGKEGEEWLLPVVPEVPRCFSRRVIEKRLFEAHGDALRRLRSRNSWRRSADVITATRPFGPGALSAVA